MHLQVVRSNPSFKQIIVHTADSYLVCVGTYQWVAVTYLEDYQIAGIVVVDGNREHNHLYENDTTAFKRVLDLFEITRGTILSISAHKAKDIRKFNASVTHLREKGWVTSEDELLAYVLKFAVEKVQATCDKLSEKAYAKPIAEESFTA